LKEYGMKKKHVVFDVDVIGGISLKEYFKENSISIFIKPPSLEVLSERLKKRNADDRKAIKNRIEKSFEEMKSIDKFDKIIVNDELSISTKNIIEIVEKFLK
jgi:guanylate kinase